MLRTFGIFRRRMSANQHRANPVDRYFVEIAGGAASDEARQEFDAWRNRFWEAIQPGVDELVAQMAGDHEELLLQAVME